MDQDCSEEYNSIGFKYLTIPVELLVCENLNPTDYIVFAIISKHDRERGCFAKNEYLCRFIGIADRTISESISRLIENGFIYRIGKDNRKRTLKVCKDITMKYEDKVQSYYEKCFSKNTQVNPAEKCGINPQNTADRITNNRKTAFSLKKTDNNSVENEPEKNEEQDTTSPASKRSVREVAKEERHKSKASPMIESLLDYYASKGFARHRQGSNVYDKSVYAVQCLLKGNMFLNDPILSKKNKAYTFAQIKQSIDNFAKAAFDLAYMPSMMGVKTTYQKTALVDFILNTFADRDDQRSKFLLYLDSEPKKVEKRIKSVEDKHPEVTKEIIKWFKHLSNTVNPKFTSEEQNQFVLASRRLMMFYEENKSKIKWGVYSHSLDSDAQRIAYLLKDTVEIYQKKKNYEKDFPIHWLSASFVYDELMPQMMKENDMLKKVVPVARKQMSTEIFKPKFNGKTLQEHMDDIHEAESRHGS
jgi:hypothetical protein